MNLSVIVCTHNPRPAYLALTLAALRAQTLDLADWELIVVDNASQPPLAENLELGWQSRGRHLREDRPGLTPARLAGIREATGDLLVFVDDDNVLDADYLAVAARIASDKPFLGCWGAGIIQPQYETPLPPQLAPYESWLCVKDVARDAYANFDHERVASVGAGLCIRRDLARRIAAELVGNETAMKLDRTGNSLACGGDILLGLKCLEYGWSIGVMKDLRIRHLIPSGRTTAEYMIGLSEGFGYSGVLMAQLMNYPPDSPRFLRRALDAFRRLASTPLQRRISQARRRGERRARAELGN